MKAFKIIYKVLIILVLIVLIGSVFMVRYVSHRAIPEYNANFSLDGLNGQVEVFRDSLGIPHIYAENEEDLYRVTGYIMAQDRLWQMDLLRHVSQGRLSEILGKDLVETDQLYRALRLEDKSRVVLERSDPEALACLKAYSEGISQCISDLRKNLPFEFTVLGYEPEPWLPIHTLNLIGYMSWSSSAAWGNETAIYRISRLVPDEKLKELIPDNNLQEAMFPEFMLEGNPQIEMDLLSGVSVVDEMGLQVFRGSNNWAVSGEHSASGKPIVCNDMHLELNIAPGIWYQMHQVVPGKVDVSGIVLPGTPFVDVGHNDSLAWGMTYVSVDDIDFYLETINPSDTNQYMLDGEWQEMEVREEIILVKGGESVKRINRFTHRGPVISSFKGINDRVISMRWSGSEYSDELKAIYLMNRADNVYDFREVLRTWTTISTNIVCGDAAGNIGLFVAAGVPLRQGNRALVMPGDTSLYDWTGFVPFEDLPYGINPPGGILASANNRSAGEDYPYHISHWFYNPSRYNRILELLSEKEVFNPDDMMRYQSDQKSKWVEKLMNLCRPVLLQADLQGSSLAAFDKIHAWDGTMDMDAIQPSLFEVFQIKLTEAIFMDELGEEFFPLLAGNKTIGMGFLERATDGQDLLWCDDVRTKDTVETIQNLVVPAWNNAVKWLEDNYGEDMQAWVWGDLHKLSITHPLGAVNLLKKIFKLERGPYRVGGADHTVSPYIYSKLKPFVVSDGASQRHVYDLADPDDSWIIMPTGVSGIPASDFFCNQTEMYLNNQYLRESFSRVNVEANAFYKSTFNPTQH